MAHHTPLTQIQGCTRDLRQTACALLSAPGPITLTEDEKAAFGRSLMNMSIEIESAVATAVVDHMLTRMESAVVDVEFVEVRP
ncbi:hypothetical protein JUN65_01920 [Gluconacetobacter azotocaptans]|uniref:hypothetical protein n=1 Tax=Gluconacetobacter azotocaptans TaxID=142834 RepID=UPI00195E6646|nr:hypothetical protein [Gluconacetobacter azotocaptans]MBM9400350.1 hypothetical protein [Gluconacetobacter azotocaptans]